MSKENPEKQKISAWVPQGLVRELDILIRNSKNPTLQTMTDGYNYCLEFGVKALADEQESDEGRYVAELFARVRRMELEEAVEAAEYKLAKHRPRDLGVRPGNLRPIRDGMEG